MVDTNARLVPGLKLCFNVSIKWTVSIFISTNTYNIWMPSVLSMGTEENERKQNIFILLARPVLVCTRFNSQA